VKRTGISRTLYGLLTLTILCAFARADTRGPAPQFTAQALDGETFTNASLRGGVILLQFWATWCQYCRRDQPVVDNIERMFADQGLTVLAVDVGESETTVRTYLQANPRSCPVVVNDGAKLASQFGAHGFPYYVVIDGEGNVAGTQGGAGGETSLRHLLSRAGLSLRSGKPDAGNQNSGASARIGKSTMIEVPGAQNALPPKPSPKTIFVFANGDRFETDHYTLYPTFLNVVRDGKQLTIALSALDINATIAVNHERGIDLKIPKSRSEVFVAF
jgi:thiol-disulfide isomerase/thioredoxin